MTLAYRLGRLPKKAIDVDDFTYYFTQELAAPKPSIAAPNLAYPMACNDVEGDCVLAAVEHSDQATSALEKITWTYAGDPATHREYRKLTGGGDTGLVESTTLTIWHKTPGLFGKVLADFAPMHVKHTTAIKQAVGLCGAVFTGVLIPAPAPQQFEENKPWALTHTPADSEIEGGHAVPIVGYNAIGPIVVTWARLQQVTWEWWLTYAEEAYALITAEVKAKGALRGVNFAALDADLAALKVA